MAKSIEFEKKKKAFENWLNGYEDEENAKELNISVSTIEKWRHEDYWLDTANTIREMALQEYNYRRAQALVDQRVKIDDRHKKTLEMLSGKVLVALKEEDVTLSTAQKLHNYSVAGSTLLNLMKTEREIFGIPNGDPGEKEGQKDKVITFQVLGDRGGMPTAAELEAELDDQDPYTAPDLHELNQRGNILQIKAGE